MRSSERAWLALAVGVTAYEFSASEDELLSAQVDRWLDRHPFITWTATIITAAHLLNLLDRHPALRAVDPFASTSLVLAKLREKIGVRS